MEDVNYLMTLSTWPPGSLRADQVNPCDTVLWPHHQPLRELRRSWSLTLPSPSFAWLLKPSKMLYNSGSGSSRYLGDPSHPWPSPAINLFFAPNSNIFSLFGLTVHWAHKLVLMPSCVWINKQAPKDFFLHFICDLASKNSYYKMLCQVQVKS